MDGGRMTYPDPDPHPSGPWGGKCGPRLLAVMNAHGIGVEQAREILGRVRPSGARPAGNLVGPSAPPSWYRVARNDAERSAEIFIYDEIGGNWWGGGVSADDFVRELAALNVDRIDIRMNTPGGDAFDGIAIYNALRVHRAQVHVYVDALAASAGSIIAMAGDQVTMRRAARMMIHDAAGWGMGNAADFRAYADLLDALSDDIASTYLARAGGTRATWREAMLAETWYDGPAAVAAGLADEHDPASDRDDADESVVPGDGGGSDPLAAWTGLVSEQPAGLRAASDVGIPADEFEMIMANWDAGSVLAALKGGAA
jgi:ATP-dependent protease ClpP protease subunit